MYTRCCNRCAESLPLGEFYMIRHWHTKEFKFRGHCKACEKRRVAKHQSANRQMANERGRRFRANNPHKHAATQAARRASKRQRTPAWSQKELIEVVYRKAQELSLEVDHYYPLNGETVSGLHVWENLQLLDKKLNCSKSNSVGG